MGTVDPCESQENEVKRLTDEVFRLQRELNWLNDKAQERTLSSLEAKGVQGEKGHRREIEEIKSSIKAKHDELEAAADALTKAEKERDACREKQGDSAGSPSFNLSGTWLDEAGREMTVTQEGNTVRAQYLKEGEEYECDPRDGSPIQKTKFGFEAKIDNDQLEGEIMVCTFEERIGLHA